MSDWTKVEKEEGTDTKITKATGTDTKITKGEADWDLEDKTDFGWFMHGWFYDWFSRTLWRIVEKTRETWTKIVKE